MRKGNFDLRNNPTWPFASHTGHFSLGHVPDGIRVRVYMYGHTHTHTNTCVYVSHIHAHMHSHIMLIHVNIFNAARLILIAQYRGKIKYEKIYVKTCIQLYIFSYITNFDTYNKFCPQQSGADDSRPH